MTMTTLTPTQDRARTAQDLLADADADFAAGDWLGGSKKMADAASCALKAVAEKRGWRCDSREDELKIARRLSNETGDDFIVSAYGGAVGYFYHNATYGFMECEDDLELTRRLTLGFMRRVLALIDAELEIPNGGESC